MTVKTRVLDIADVLREIQGVALAARGAVICDDLHDNYAIRKQTREEVLVRMDKIEAYTRTIRELL